jgi:hypothetical protein
MFVCSRRWVRAENGTRAALIVFVFLSLVSNKHFVAAIARVAKESVWLTNPGQREESHLDATVSRCVYLGL